jgi:DNA-binding LytR/AlgR family response regulator
MIIAEDLKDILENLGYSVEGIAISAREALQLIEEYSPDLLLLDIHLKGGKDGIDLAHEIRDHYRIPFIFLTSHADKQTLLRAREVNPYGYILKPFEDQAIDAAIQIALANFEKDMNQVSQSDRSDHGSDMILNDSLFVRSNGMLVKIRFADILYLEADGNYTNVYAKDKRFALRSILKALEEKLTSHHFVRIHKSYLVNLAQIDAIDSQSVHIGNKEIPISRSQHSWLLNQIKTL